MGGGGGQGQKTVKSVPAGSAHAGVGAMGAGSGRSEQMI